MMNERKRDSDNNITMQVIKIMVKVLMIFINSEDDIYDNNDVDSDDNEEHYLNDDNNEF